MLRPVRETVAGVTALPTTWARYRLSSYFTFPAQYTGIIPWFPWADTKIHLFSTEGLSTSYVHSLQIQQMAPGLTGWLKERVPSGSIMEPMQA